MRRASVLCFLAVLAFAALAHAEEEPPAPDAQKEAIRLRLIEAYASRPRVHHALAYRGVDVDGERCDVHVETFVDGDVAGLCAWRLENPDERLCLLGTNGRVLCRRQAGRLLWVMEGAATMRRHVAPYLALVRSWGRRWSVDVGPEPAWCITFDLGLTEEEPDLGMGIDVDAVPRWLRPDVLQDADLALDEEAGIVIVRRGDVEGRFCLADGLPVLWTRRDASSDRRVHAASVPTLWTEEEWRAAIDDVCSGQELADVTRSLRDWHPGLRWAVNVAVQGGAWRLLDPAELKRVAREISEVEVRHRVLDETDSEAAERYVETRVRLVEEKARSVRTAGGWPDPLCTHFATLVGQALEELLAGELGQAQRAAAKAKEDLRQRLVRAYRALPRVHHALRCDGHEEDGLPSVLLIEAFVEGDVGGIRVWKPDEPHTDFAFLATDGRVAVVRAQDEVHLAMEGAETMRTSLEPYERQIRAWGERWACETGPPHRWGVALRLGLSEDKVNFGMNITSDAVPEWLSEDYLAERTLAWDEAQGVARIRDEVVEGALRLQDGLPVSWRRHGVPDEKRASLALVATSWTPDAWREAIARGCEGQDLADLELSMRRDILMGMLRLLAAATKHGEHLTTPEEMERVAREIAEVEVQAQPPKAWTEETLDAYVTKRLELVASVARTNQEHSGWSQDTCADFVQRVERELRNEVERHRAALRAAPSCED